MNNLEKKHKTPVTIIIGIKCKNGILMACESRTSDPKTGVIHDDAQKLETVLLNDGNGVFIGQAGNDDLSHRAIEIIRSKAERVAMSDHRTVADIAQDACVELKGQLRQQYFGTGEEQQKHFETYAFELMIAYYYREKPYIFTLDFALGQARQQSRDYVSIGCGAILADFLLRSLNVRDYSTRHAIWTAMYTIEEIKKCDGRCGGPTNVGVVTIKDGKSHIYTAAQEWLGDYTQEVQEFSLRHGLEWKQKIESAVEETLQKRTKKKQLSQGGEDEP